MKTSFPMTCWLSIKYISKNWLFFLTYLFCHTTFLYFFYLLLYFYKQLHIFYLVNSWISTVLVILWGLLFIYIYTKLHVWAMNELKNNFVNPKEKINFIHWNNYPINLLMPFSNMAILLMCSSFLFICLVVPYLISIAFFFFLPVVISFYPNADKVEYWNIVKKTVDLSKNIRLYLGLFGLIFFFVPMVLLIFLTNLGFNLWINIGLVMVFLSLYPIFQYTTGTIYFYHHWEKE